MGVVTTTGVVVTDDAMAGEVSVGEWVEVLVTAPVVRLLSLGVMAQGVRQSVPLPGQSCH